MQAPELELLEALRALDSAVKSMPTSNPKPNLLALFLRIDEIAAGMTGRAHPELLHFIHRKSYEKAIAWLENHASTSRS